MSFVEELKQVLKDNANKRIAVVGTTCSGKSTLMDAIPEAQDMDELVFPLLSKEESDYVCKTPWTPEIGETMNKLVREKVKIEKGKPVFGTVVIDCDLVVYLDVSDALLKERTAKRKAKFEDAKAMQEVIWKEVNESGIPFVVIKEL